MSAHKVFKLCTDEYMAKTYIYMYSVLLYVKIIDEAVVHPLDPCVYSPTLVKKTTVSYHFRVRCAYNHFIHWLARCNTTS